MRLQLFDDRLFVILNKVEEKKIGSLYVPDNHDERSRIGTVMEVGPGLREWNGTITPMNYKVGDKVLVSWYTGVRVHLPGEKMYGDDVCEETSRVVRECEILGKVLED